MYKVFVSILFCIPAILFSQEYVVGNYYLLDSATVADIEADNIILDTSVVELDGSVLYAKGQGNAIVSIPDVSTGIKSDVIIVEDDSLNKHQKYSVEFEDVNDSLFVSFNNLCQCVDSVQWKIVQSDNYFILDKDSGFLLKIVNAAEEYSYSYLMADIYLDGKISSEQKLFKIEHTPQNAEASDFVFTVDTIFIEIGSEIQNDDLKYNLGDSIDLVPDYDGGNYWQTSDSSIVYFDSQGNLIANDVGYANIWFSSDGNWERDQQKVVCVSPDNIFEIPSGGVINITDDMFSLHVGHYRDIAYVTSGDVGSLTWISDNEQVVTVDQNGRAIGVGSGSTKVRVVSSVDPSIFSLSYITVYEILPEELSIGIDSLVMYEMTMQKLSATLLPENVFNKQLLWSVSNHNIADIDNNGNLTVYKQGSFDVVVRSEVSPDVADTVTVTVKYNPSLYHTAELGHGYYASLEQLFPDAVIGEQIHIEGTSVLLKENNVIYGDGLGEVVIETGNGNDFISSKLFITVVDDYEPDSIALVVDFDLLDFKTILIRFDFAVDESSVSEDNIVLKQVKSSGVPIFIKEIYTVDGEENAFAIQFNRTWETGEVIELSSESGIYTIDNRNVKLDISLGQVNTSLENISEKLSLYYDNSSRVIVVDADFIINEINLVNVLGESFRLIGNNNSFNANNLPKGLYWVLLKVDGRTVHKKLIVR